MIKISKILALFAIVLLLPSCERDDDSRSIPLRDFQTQYVTDLGYIETFLKTHSYTVTQNPGAHDDQDVTFEEVEMGDPASIWNSGDLLSKTVRRHDIDYTLYYLKFREGGGADIDNLRDQPSNVDAVLAAYEGRLLRLANAQDSISTPGVRVGDLLDKVFETNAFPSSFLRLESTVYGWREMFPEFRPGDRISETGQPNVYTDFGAGVMFLPSGLAYYNQGQGNIPAYTPLIFAFKLYDINRLDHDNDGIPSYLEDNGDRYIRLDEQGRALDPEDDSDGDGVPDYLDVDDDNDGVITKVEIRRPKNPADPNAPYTYYSFHGAAVDDPSTPHIDERRGIPSCFTTTPTLDPVTGQVIYNEADFTSETRLRRHLDPLCKPPYGDEFAE